MYFNEQCGVMRSGSKLKRSVVCSIQQKVIKVTIKQKEFDVACLWSVMGVIQPVYCTTLRCGVM